MAARQATGTGWRRRSRAGPAGADCVSCRQRPPRPTDAAHDLPDRRQGALLVVELGLQDAQVRVGQVAASRRRSILRAGPRSPLGAVAPRPRRRTSRGSTVLRGLQQVQPAAVALCPLFQAGPEPGDGLRGHVVVTAELVESSQGRTDGGGPGLVAGHRGSRGTGAQGRRPGRSA